MLTQQLIFYIFAATVVGSAIMVVVLNNPVRCALFLVLAFLASAGLWILAYAEFLALVLVLVYVGAVMTLFLFVIMMLDINIVSMRRHFVRYLPFGLIVVGLLVLLIVMAVRPEHFDFARLTQAVIKEAQLSNVASIGRVLYTEYVYAFELAAVLLLVAIVSAIALAHRGSQTNKTQSILKQLLVRRDERVHLVKMRAEKKQD